MSVKKQIDGALLKGTIIKSPNHKYLVEEVLGAGGFGITYKVLRISDSKTFALKEYFPSLICTRGEDNTTLSYFKTNSDSIKTGIEDFLTEAKRLNRQNVSHPNIVAVDEAFNANGTAYYAMEYIDGLNLRQYIVKHNHNRPMSEEQALSVMKLVLQAVALLHSNKLTHLDIKHENIILSQEEDGAFRPVLIDFGQSKHYDRKGNATSQLTNAGCSDGFAPQEQYLGLSQFTPQADVYALCATLLYLVTAKVPAKSSEITPSLIKAMLGDNVSEKVKDAILAGMKSSKTERIQSVEMLAEKLGLEIADQNQEYGVTRMLNITSHGGKLRNRQLHWSVASLIGLLIVGSFVWFSNNGTTSEQSEVADEDSITSFESTNGLTSLVEKPNVSGTSLEQRQEPSKDERQIQQRKSDDLRKQAQVEENNIGKISNMSTSSKPESQVTQQASSSQSEQQHSSDSDDQLFVKANSTGDWDTMQKLADRGYKKAYLPLAKHYCSKARTHSLADKYAKMAKAAGISGADDVISVLEGLGYYD